MPGRQSVGARGRSRAGSSRASAPGRRPSDGSAPIVVSGGIHVACHACPYQRPDADRDPRNADHIGLHGQREHCGERGGQRRFARTHERPERAQYPAEPEQTAEDAELDAELRVVPTPPAFSSVVRSLPPSGRRCRARNSPASMVHERPEGRPQAPPVLARRRVVDRVAARARRGAPRTRAARRGRRASEVAPVGATDGRRAPTRLRSRSSLLQRRGQPAPPHRGEDDEPGRERDERRARERPEQTGRCDDAEHERESASQEPHGEQQSHGAEYAAPSWAEEGRDEPPQEVLLGAGVVDEVLRQPAGAEPARKAEVAEVVDDAVRPPPADRDRVDVDEADRRNGRCGAERGPREPS